VINSNQLIIGVLSGSILIVFGLVPGLLQGLTQGVRNFSDILLSSRFPPPSYPRTEVQPPGWLAPAGITLVAATVLAYLSN
jgi:hypothetical protein